MELDQKAKESMQWFAIYGAVAAAAETLVSKLAASWFMSSVNIGGYNIALGQTFSFGGIVNSAVWGAVSGAIFGWVLSKYYSQIIGFTSKYLGKYMDNLFKLLFYPYVVAFLLSALGAGATTLFAGSAGLALLVSFAGTLAIRYFFAKMLVAKIGQYYPAVTSASTGV